MTIERLAEKLDHDEAISVILQPYTNHQPYTLATGTVGNDGVELSLDIQKITLNVLSNPSRK